MKDGLVTRRIAQEKAHAKARTGEEPTRLYVGREEWDRLRLEALSHGFLIGEALEGDARLEASGLLVFVVNADSHFCVC